MMKILLLSDTHGDLSKALTVCQKLKNIDLIIHCGDYQDDAHQLEEELGIPVVSVGGNCDHAPKEDKEIVETPYGNLLVTHGHYEMVGYSYQKLLYLAEERDCIAVCFGHTHVAYCEEFDGIRLINPGSLTSPRDGSGGTYAVIHSSEEEFYANIVRYDTVFKDADSGKSTSGNGGSKADGSKGDSSKGGNPPVKPKAKVQGGFLRGLLNYSDRF